MGYIYVGPHDSSVNDLTPKTQIFRNFRQKQILD